MVADADTERAMGKDSLGSVDGAVEREIIISTQPKGNTKTALE